MKNLMRTLAIAGVAGFLSLGLAACDEAGDEQSEAPPPPSQPETAPAAPPTTPDTQPTTPPTTPGTQ